MTRMITLEIQSHNNLFSVKKEKLPSVLFMVIRPDDDPFLFLRICREDHTTIRIHRTGMVISMPVFLYHSIFLKGDL